MNRIPVIIDCDPGVDDTAAGMSDAGIGYSCGNNRSRKCWTG